MMAKTLPTKSTAIQFQDWPACIGTGFFGNCLAPVARDSSRKMVSKDHKLSVPHQCALLTLARSNLYYEQKGESAENLKFMAIIDKQFLETPWYGSRQMARYMKRNNHACGRHRVRRLMRLMRLVPLYQEPNTSKKHPQHKIWPYLLQNVIIDRPNKCLVRRYYIYSNAAWLSVSRGDHGLVQTQDFGMTALQQHGHGVLRRSPKRGAVKT